MTLDSVFPTRPEDLRDEAVLAPRRPREAAVRFLFLTDRLPYPPRGGAALRNWALLLAVSAWHQVELLSFGHPDLEVPAPLSEICDAVTLVPPPDEIQGKELVQAYFVAPDSTLPWEIHTRTSRTMARLVAGRSRKADVVVAFQLGMSQYLDEVRGAVRVYDAHNVESSVLEQIARLRGDPLQRLYATREAERSRRYEAALGQKADLILAVTDAVAAGLRALAPTARISTVPIALVLDQYPDLWQPGEPRICFFGDLAWPPNVDAAIHLCRDVLPRLDEHRVRVVLTGKRPVPEVQALAGPQVQVTGFVPDMEETLRGDAIAVAPLRAGSGMRVKVLEAMAWSLPVVSTPLGCEGIDHGGALLEAEGAEAMASTLGRLLGNQSLRRQLGRAGRDRVARLYGHEAVGRRFLDALADLGATTS
jgi:glycosyltransferase involved in cell wall biosynthesis